MTTIRSLFFAFCMTTGTLAAHPPTPQLTRNLIILDPAGHAGQVGRKLSQGYERGETLKFAEALQKTLGQSHNIRAALTRLPGEQKRTLQAASFTNQLNPDLLLSIHLYKEEAAKPKIFLYQLAYNPLIDFTRRTENPLALIPFHQAHFKKIHTSKAIGEQMKQMLMNQELHKTFDFHGPFALPLKPLAGITAPALLLEIGINKDSQWQTLVNPIAESISTLIATR